MMLRQKQERCEICEFLNKYNIHIIKQLLNPKVEKERERERNPAFSYTISSIAICTHCIFRHKRTMPANQVEAAPQERRESSINAREMTHGISDAGMKTQTPISIEVVVLREFKIVSEGRT